MGAPFPPPALHPDLGLTSPLTGVSRPDSCGPCGEQLPPRPRRLPRSRLQWESSPGQAGPSLQLPGLGHDGRDMLLFFNFIFLQKEPVSIHRPSEKPGRPGRASIPSPTQRLVVRGGPAGSSGQGGAGTAQPHSPSHKRVHLTLECTTHPGCREGPPSLAHASCCCPVPKSLRVPHPQEELEQAGLDGEGHCQPLGADTETSRICHGRRPFPCSEN